MSKDIITGVQARFGHGGQGGLLAGGHDGAADLQVQTSTSPAWGPYKKLPIAGGHIYLSMAEPFASYFFWEGQPDRGFGGRKRVVDIDDGTQETVIGGWSSRPAVVEEAGGPKLVHLSYKPADGKYDLYYAADMLLDAVHEILGPMLAEQGVSLTESGEPHWTGRPTMRVWREQQRERIAPIRDALDEKYKDAPKHLPLSKIYTPEEYDSIMIPSYTDLGPA